MIILKNFIIIGAADRNVGKTELACFLINKISKQSHVIGLKITTIRETNGLCPRGGKGCGVCSSLEGNYCITQEESSYQAKDTSRMLKAGATKVFWIRSLESHLDEAINEFLSILKERYDENIPVVCESNTARTAVDPSLFLVLNKLNNSNIKKSCQVVYDLADTKINLISKKEGFDFDINSISFERDKWIIKKSATVIILAGGLSSRMGRNKALLKYSNGTAVDYIIQQIYGIFTEHILSSNVHVDSKYNILQVNDISQNIGPLMGIYSCLLKSKTDKNFVISCDAPIIDLHELNRMLEISENYDAVVLQHGDNEIEPLFAIYKKSIIPYIEKSMKEKKYSIRSFFQDIKVYYHNISNSTWYVNINTPEDYSKFLERGL